MTMKQNSNSAASFNRDPPGERVRVAVTIHALPWRVAVKRGKTDTVFVSLTRVSDSYLPSQARGQSLGKWKGRKISASSNVNVGDGLICL